MNDTNVVIQRADHRGDRTIIYRGKEVGHLAPSRDGMGHRLPYHAFIHDHLDGDWISGGRGPQDFYADTLAEVRTGVQRRIRSGDSLETISMATIAMSRRMNCCIHRSKF